MTYRKPSIKRVVEVQWVKPLSVQSKPPSPKILSETPVPQIRYMGLIIEKDEEYKKVDRTPRKYIPIRDKYISIVKNSRIVIMEALERKGKSHLKQTQRNLRLIAHDLKLVKK